MRSNFAETKIWELPNTLAYLLAKPLYVKRTKAEEKYIKALHFVLITSLFSVDQLLKYIKTY